VAVYSQEAEYCSADDEEDAPNDPFSCVFTRDMPGPHDSSWLKQVLFNYKGPEIAGYGEETIEADLLMDQLGAWISWDVIWVRRPKRFQFVSTYATYGNSPEVGLVYVAAAFVVRFVSVKDGVRVVWKPKVENLPAPSRKTRTAKALKFLMDEDE